MKRSVEPEARQLALEMEAQREVSELGLFRLGINLDKVGDKNYLTHNFHPYPAKFIPQIPRAVIEKYSKPGEPIVDPFCGSGTTLVEACLTGRAAIGNDLNPIACLISSAKTARINEVQANMLNGLLLDINDKLLRLRNEGNAVLGLTTDDLPSFHNRDHWFEQQALMELAYIRKAIKRLVISPADLLALTAFSSIIVKVSRQESDTRWVAVNKGYTPGFALESFAIKLSDMIPRSVAFTRLVLTSATVTQGDATLLSDICSGIAALVVTSPPYLNSYDYYLYHKLRLFWLGYDHRAVQANEIGSRNRHCDLGEDIESYRRSMMQCLKEIRRILRPHGVLAIIIGDAVFKGKLVRMDEFYDTMCETSGFRKIETHQYDQRRYTLSFTKGYKTIPKLSYILIYSM